MTNWTKEFVAGCKIGRRVERKVGLDPCFIIGTGIDHRLKIARNLFTIFGQGVSRCQSRGFGSGRTAQGKHLIEISRCCSDFDPPARPVFVQMVPPELFTDDRAPFRSGIQQAFLDKVTDGFTRGGTANT
nr:hypothetical protein [Paracoccus sp. JM45]